MCSRSAVTPENLKFTYERYVVSHLSIVYLIAGDVSKQLVGLQAQIVIFDDGVLLLMLLVGYY